MTKTDALKDRYAEVLERIDRAARRSGRTGADVCLVAVSKYAEIDLVRELVALGHRDLGENHVQAIVQRAAVAEEWLARAKALPSVKAPAPAPLRWHMIGRLQRNKTRKAVELCRLIHSAENLRVIEDVQQAANRLGVTADVLVQVNTSGEGSKQGCAPAAVLHLIEMVETMINVRVRGLMTMAPHDASTDESRATFERLRELFEEARRIGLGGREFNILSMGMSGDYEVAIEEGANMVRVGSAIFGEAPASADRGEEKDEE
jgi:pyridoxal phosphate enzyme (YggS family)